MLLELIMDDTIRSQEGGFYVRKGNRYCDGGGGGGGGGVLGGNENRAAQLAAQRHPRQA